MSDRNNPPGDGAVAEILEFMKKMWGGMGASGMGMPSLSVDEINKKILDLKTVASWLELNMQMLRATIQALEVQSATLSNLQAMGAVLTPSGEKKAAAASQTFVVPPADFSEWLQKKPSPQQGQTSDAITGAQETGTSPMPDLPTSVPNPNVWWGRLQEQFQQAISNVLTEQAPVKQEDIPEVRDKKERKIKTLTKTRTRSKSTVVQSGGQKSISRKPKSP